MKTLLLDGQTYRIEDEDFLVIVNGEPRYVVKTAPDVIAAILLYAQTEGLEQYTVSGEEVNAGEGGRQDTVRLLIEGKRRAPSDPCSLLCLRRDCLLRVGSKAGAPPGN